MKVSVSAAFYDRTTRTVLLLKEAPYEGGTQVGKWGLPGGTVNENETWREALRRELVEEIGVDYYDIQLQRPITDVAVVVAQQSHSDRLRLATLMVIAQRFEVKLSDDHCNYLWFDVLDMPASTAMMPGLQRVVFTLLQEYANA